MNDQFKAVDGDPDGPIIIGMFDARADNWILTAPGYYKVGAAEAWQDDGSQFQQVILLEWPGRFNHTTEHTTVRLMMKPEDAVGLAEVLMHSAQWLIDHGYKP